MAAPELDLGRIASLIVAAAPNALLVLDRRGRIHFLNARAEALFGYSKDELAGRSILDVLAPAAREGFLETLTWLAPVARPDLEGRRRSGDQFPMDVQLRALRTADDDLILCAITDATEHKRTEQRLRESESRLRRLIDEMPVMVDAFDEAGRVVFWNKECERVTGYSAHEIVGNPRALELLYPDADYRGRMLREWQQRTDYYRDWEWTITAKDGSSRIVAWSNIAQQAPLPGWRTWGVGRDVTLRRDAQRALLESEARFRNMADHSSVMIWVSDAAGACIYLNRLWYDFTGQTPQNALGRGWIEALHPDDRTRNAALFREPNASVRLEYRLRRHDGLYRWCLDACTPRFSDTGELLGYIGSVMDITERKEAEEAMQAADRRKDEFLATLAHELRNPLAPILSAVHYLQFKGSNEPNARNAGDIIERQTRLMARLVDDLLDLSRITRGRITLQKERLSLGVALTSAIEGCRPLIEAADHRLEVRSSQSPLYVYGDLARLTQVFVNLLNNAVKYTPRSGCITVVLERSEQEAVVRIRDTGVGIPPEMLQRIFEMFVQLDASIERAHGGLGIGLTLAQQLAHMHGGRIEAQSAGVGGGSEFAVYLPLAHAADEAVELHEPPAARSADHRRVLVADDNVDAVSTIKMLLEAAGHEVHTAHDGHAALAAAARIKPDVVLLDIGMPQLNGYEAARRIRALPGGEQIMLVALTGWGQEQDKRRARDAGFDHHVTKPADPELLLHLISHRSEPAAVQ